MEYIYFAVSDSHPGMVKIGRTDRPVDDRMSELSSDDYGLSGFDGDSSWEAVNVIMVEDNVKAEGMLHEYFDSARVEQGREIFYTDDVNKMAESGTELVDGTSIDFFAADAGNLEGIFADNEGLSEALTLEDFDISELLSEGGEVTDVLLELGVLGIGVAGAAIAYQKYKDKKAVKNAVNTVSQVISDGKKKWDDSADGRKRILDKSNQTATKIWQSSSEFRYQVKNASAGLSSRVKNKLKDS